MPFLILGIVVLIVCFLVIRKRSTLGFGSSRKCNWRVDHRRSPARTMVRWTCRSCGVEAFSSDGRPPKECKRRLRDARL